MNKLIITLLRIAIGWHFLYEGLVKLAFIVGSDSAFNKRNQTLSYENY